MENEIDLLKLVKQIEALADKLLNDQKNTLEYWKTENEQNKKRNKENET